MKNKLITVAVSLTLPQDFQEACKTADINPSQSIQSFIYNVSIYCFMVTARTTEACSLASALFKDYVLEMTIKPIANPDKRDIGLFYMKLMVQLVRSRISRQKKEIIYQIIIAAWYADLLKIENV